MSTARPVIYSLSDPRTGAVRYIGKTLRVGKRLAEHLRDASSTRKARWLRSLAQVGLAPRFAVLTECTAANWEQEERRLIAEARAAGCDLTNHTEGGEGVCSPDEEARKRLSEASKVRMRDPGVRAKVFTPERGQKISAALSGRTKSAEHVLKLPQNRPGRKLSPVHAARAREALAQSGYRHPKGEPMHPNARKALALSSVGNKHTLGRKMPEHEKAQRSAANKGKTKSEETKAKMRAARLAYWARKKSAAADGLSVTA